MQHEQGEVRDLLPARRGLHLCDVDQGPARTHQAVPVHERERAHAEIQGVEVQRRV